jgi:hypothetical protein
MDPYPLLPLPFLPVSREGRGGIIHTISDHPTGGRGGWDGAHPEGTKRMDKLNKSATMRFLK